MNKISHKKMRKNNNQSAKYTAKPDQTPICQRTFDQSFDQYVFTQFFDQLSIKVNGLTTNHTDN